MIQGAEHTGMNPVHFNWNGNDITFQKGENVMVNATEMAKPFGKRPIDWLRLPKTQEYIEALYQSRNYGFDNDPEPKVRKSHFGLVRTEQGGRRPGTWMHKDLALEFARWLDAVFAIWCNDRIMELMTHGVTALPSTIDAMLQDPDVMIEALQQLKQERAEKQAALKENAYLKPRAEFAELITQSPDDVDMGTAARILEMPYGRNQLFKTLRNDNILMKNNQPYERYRKFFNVKTGKFMVNGVARISTKTEVTPLGLAFLKKRYLNNKPE